LKDFVGENSSKSEDRILISTPIGRRDVEKCKVEN
jgi:hypothetical protein